MVRTFISSLLQVILLAGFAAFVHATATNNNAAARRTAVCNNACKITGSQAYVAAVISHSDKDINRIPLAANVTRFENLNGGPYSFTANGTKSLKDSLKYGNTAFFVTGSAEPDGGLGKYTVFKNGTVFAVYRIKAGLFGLGFATSLVRERFDFTTDGGLLYNITAEAVTPSPS
ncbi:unnamed protein product [Tilletia controversa]|uniref:Uncharacterized protein n=3 Tax=Tilletia TaxID=13289 RepID=A0A8X7SXN3_9BASI|nr:hypothetical protein CF336_g4561 [Tilletia laevis]KAE8199097.1 hypothetical protein CF328_g3347 [Tilletia controversa]KAE8261472.1 hypothetical protein A4X03_0g3228 [Tilletia caries]KAE8201254.1 hypothetical protein CF335_g3780 [Tilletia laevis]KAE8249094.1 hypothetical protein A4X06_0g3387 [Tilletia controversa]